MEWNEKNHDLDLSSPQVYNVISVSPMMACCIPYRVQLEKMGGKDSMELMYVFQWINPNIMKLYSNFNRHEE